MISEYQSRSSLKPNSDYSSIFHLQRTPTLASPLSARWRSSGSRCCTCWWARSPSCAAPRGLLIPWCCSFPRGGGQDGSSLGIRPSISYVRIGLLRSAAWVAAWRCSVPWIWAWALRLGLRRSAGAEGLQGWTCPWCLEWWLRRLGWRHC